MIDPTGWDDNFQLPNPFRHCTGGLHIGPMHPEPKAGEFASVLTLASYPGSVDDSIRHRHIPLSYQVMDMDRLETAINWVIAQFDADRTVLVRSEGGKQRPGLVVAGAFLRLGGTYFDAVGCVHRANHLALNDFRYTNILRDMDGR